MQRTLRRRGADAHGGIPGRPEAGRVTAFCLPACRRAAGQRCACEIQAAAGIQDKIPPRSIQMERGGSFCIKKTTGNAGGSKKL